MSARFDPLDRSPGPIPWTDPLDPHNEAAILLLFAVYTRYAVSLPMLMDPHVDGSSFFLAGLIKSSVKKLNAELKKDAEATNKEPVDLEKELDETLDKVRDYPSQLRSLSTHTHYTRDAHDTHDTP